MSHLSLFIIDLVAICVLTFGIYFPRHRRRDMLLAYIGLNIGVLAVTTALANSTVTAGLGLGLFGVLSIIRLRSTELTQEEVAYYFVSLAMGLLCGVSITPAWLTPALLGAMVAAVFVVDSPMLFTRYRQTTVTLDAAYPDEREMVARLEAMLGASVKHFVVTTLDLVRDLTVVDVRYQLHARRSTGEAITQAGGDAHRTSAPARWSDERLGHAARTSS